MQVSLRLSSLEDPRLSGDGVLDLQKSYVAHLMTYGLMNGPSSGILN